MRSEKEMGQLSEASSAPVRLENPHLKQIWILHCESGVLPVISERMYMSSVVIANQACDW